MKKTNSTVEEKMSEAKPLLLKEARAGWMGTQLEAERGTDNFW